MLQLIATAHLVGIRTRDKVTTMLQESTRGGHTLEYTVGAVAVLALAIFLFNVVDGAVRGRSAGIN